MSVTRALPGLLFLGALRVSSRDMLLLISDDLAIDSSVRLRAIRCEAHGTANFCIEEQPAGGLEMSQMTVLCDQRISAKNDLKLFWC